MQTHGKVCRAFPLEPLRNISISKHPVSFKIAKPCEINFELVNFKQV
ncbi:hypothetical protein SAMN05216323_10344 [Williamwhitmania taraxaci]|uniref:Uncharacterized protein n=1 Tax=Williamwhitmania taraxaci TaxID=1640674 RepID=A0A1G6M2F8_9BACT|nr:hypothetical protein SAMN05216323_10344 [Williamwhitmania taraxaci]